MAYKDKEKQREYQREWDKKNRKGKSHKIWWGYGYEDSMPDNWRELAGESGYEILAMFHDKDLTATGEIKEPHWHIAVRLSHAGKIQDAKEALLPLGVKEASLQWRDSWTAVARYLCHMDDPNKAQYDPNLVLEFGGADYLNATNRTADKYRVVAEMQDWVDSGMNEGIAPSFKALCDYARLNELTWFMALCDNTAIIMREYCKSARYDFFNRGMGSGSNPGE